MLNLLPPPSINNLLFQHSNLKPKTRVGTPLKSDSRYISYRNGKNSHTNFGDIWKIFHISGCYYLGLWMEPGGVVILLDSYLTLYCFCCCCMLWVCLYFFNVSLTRSCSVLFCKASMSFQIVTIHPYCISLLMIACLSHEYYKSI